MILQLQHDGGPRCRTDLGTDLGLDDIYLRIAHDCARRRAPPRLSGTELRRYEQGYQFRMLVEPAALLEPGYRIDRPAFRRVRTQQRAVLESRWPISRAAIFEAGVAFHTTITGGAGNAFITNALARVNELRRLVESRVKVNRAEVAQHCEQHLQLLDLIEAGELTAAADFLRQHLESARKAAMELS